jgi:hypothetical protein
VLESGKVTAFDGTIAASLIAKQLVPKLAKLRQPPGGKPESKDD